MGIMDDMKGDASNMDAMKARFEELKSKEQSGAIDDKGREELTRLRSQFDK